MHKACKYSTVNCATILNCLADDIVFAVYVYWLHMIYFK